MMVIYSKKFRLVISYDALSNWSSVTGTQARS